ncbi:MAG: paraquat-inducible protein A [Candidatus Brocadiales bacterium]|nr:paraquat-inducible protein A [Candidatus Brocadiales bacterium]
MNKNRLYYFYIIALLYVVGAAFSGHTIYSQSKKYADDKSDYVDVLNFEDRLLTIEEWIYTGSKWDDRDLASKEKLKNSKIDYSVEKKYSYCFIAESIAFIITVLIVYCGRANLFQALGLAIITIALACLIIGVITPMLEISAYSTNLTIPLKFSVPFIGEVDIPDKVFEGRMYYYYQSKSVIDLINVLLESKNYVVAVSIFGFSVLVPFIKLTLSILLLLSRPFRDNGFVKKTVGRIGKWSMADVFVVATFLSYLSFSNMNSGINTEAKTLVGLYFFLAYCILSIASSQVIELTVRKERETLLNS